MMNRRAHLLAGLVLLFSGGAAGADQPCPEVRTLYIAVETAAEPLGLRGETRRQYLDRRYGAGKWRPDEDGLVRFTPPGSADVPIRVSVAAPQEGAALARADVIVEARLDFIDEAEHQTVIYGHRETASYPLTPGTDAEISVPWSLFKEPGALLVAVALTGGGEPLGPRVIVQALPVEPASCERRVYAKDRFTAIRLNRRQP